VVNAQSLNWGTTQSSASCWPSWGFSLIFMKELRPAFARDTTSFFTPGQVGSCSVRQRQSLSFFSGVAGPDQSVQFGQCSAGGATRSLILLPTQSVRLTRCTPAHPGEREAGRRFLPISTI